MQFPIVFLCLVAAASAAPQLFFVVPPQFLETKSQQELNNLIPVIVPFNKDLSATATANQEVNAVGQGSEPLFEAAKGTSEFSDVSVVAPEESLPIVPEQLESVSQDQTDPQIVTETTTDNAAIEEIGEVPVEETPVQEEPSATEQPSDVFPKEEEIILPESTLNVVDTPSEIKTNEIVPAAVETLKAEELVNAEPSSGKSINSFPSHNSIHSTAIVTHFGFNNPNAIVRSQPTTIMHQGAVVDPKTLVPPQFRHFIYQNDAPEVVAAKVAFFRVQAALTPRNRL